MTEVIELHIDIETDGQLAVDLLAKASGLSKQLIKQAMKKGAVWQGRDKNIRRLRRASKELSQGESLHLYYNQKVLSEIPKAPILIADEGDYSVWDKPYGMRSQGSKWGDHCTINRWVETNLVPQRPAFIVHRLDRAATGLIIIAHKKSSAAELSAQFKSRKIEKRYRALVAGCFPESEEPIIFDSDIEGKAARSSATRLAYDPATGWSDLEIGIDTGRKHQIRRHLSENGFPIVGDRLYGKTLLDEDLKLRSCFLAFEYPVGGTRKEYRLDD